MKSEFETLKFGLKPNEDCKVKYNKFERDVFTLIPQKSKDGPKIDPLETTALAELYYSKFRRTKVPFHGQTTVGGVIRNMEKKIALNQEGFRLKRTKRGGPNPIKVWVEEGRGR